MLRQLSAVLGSERVAAVASQARTRFRLDVVPADGPFQLHLLRLGQLGKGALQGTSIDQVGDGLSGARTPLVARASSE